MKYISRGQKNILILAWWKVQEQEMGFKKMKILPPVHGHDSVRSSYQIFDEKKVVIFLGIILNNKKKNQKILRLVH